MNRTNTATLAVLLAVIVGPLRAQEKPSADPGPMGSVMRMVSTNGSASEFSGYLALRLGIVPEEREVVVNEVAVQIGRDLKAVDLTPTHDLLFVAKIGEQIFLYLASADGVLQKTLRIRLNEVPDEPSPRDAAKGFEQEKQFWLDMADKAGWTAPQAK